MNTQDMTYEEKIEKARQMLAAQGYDDAEIEKILEQAFEADK